MRRVGAGGESGGESLCLMVRYIWYRATYSLRIPDQHQRGKQKNLGGVGAGGSKTKNYWPEGVNTRLLQRPWHVPPIASNNASGLGKTAGGGGHETSHISLTPEVKQPARRSSRTPRR